ncbi:MAG: hypothetical protein AAF716_05910 [Cyanobacteria bacterium P01_D01_bin.1]
MAQQLKRWESPRRKGRNHKGRGGSAKQRQYKKRQKRLIQQLKGETAGSPASKPADGKRGHMASFFCLFFMFAMNLIRLTSRYAIF